MWSAYRFLVLVSVVNCPLFFTLSFQRRIRAVLAEKDVPSWGRAETAVKLIDMNYSVEDSIEAACNCGDLMRSLRYLQQECPLCLDKKPMSQV